MIGHNGQLAWHLRSDLQQFKARTLHHAIIMGRRTWQSLRGALPQRHNIIMTRQQAFCVPADTPNVELVRSKAAALRAAQAYAPDKPPMIIGGAQIYRQFETDAAQIFLTRVHARPHGDTQFALQDPQDWETKSQSRHAPGAQDDHAFSFVVLQKRAPQSA